MGLSRKACLEERIILNLIMKQLLDLAFALSEEHQAKVESSHELPTILL